MERRASKAGGTWVCVESRSSSTAVVRVTLSDEAARRGGSVVYLLVRPLACAALEVERQMAEQQLHQLQAAGRERAFARMQADRASAGANAQTRPLDFAARHREDQVSLRRLPSFSVEIVEKM